MLTGMFAAGGGIDTNLEVGVEKAIGTITINGTTYTRYVKIINFGALPNSTLKDVNINENYVGILGCYAIASKVVSGVVTAFTIPRSTINVTDGKVSYNNDIYVTNNAIRITTGSDMSTYSAIAIVEYYR